PGGAFTKVADLGYTDTLLDGTPSAALRPDGAAIVAWLDLSDDQAMAIRRDAPGPFGPPEKVGPKPLHPYAQELPDFDGGAPAARTAPRRSVTARLRVPRLPPFLGLRAVLRGKRIVVSWHTDRPLRHATVIAVSSEDKAFEDPFLGSSMSGGGHTRFRLSV